MSKGAGMNWFQLQWFSWSLWLSEKLNPAWRFEAGAQQRRAKQYEAHLLRLGVEPDYPDGSAR